MDELTKLEKLLDNFRIIGQDGITVHGSLRTGYAVQTQPISGAGVSGFPGGVVPPPQPLGACCYDDGTCNELNEVDCNNAGGNWQGEGTTCSDTDIDCPNACPTPDATVTITLSGLVNCSCSPGVVGSGGSSAFNMSLDGSYPLTFTGDFGGPIFEFFDSPGTYGNITNYPNETCTDPPSECDPDTHATTCPVHGLHIFAHCLTGLNEWVIAVQSPYVGPSPIFTDFAFDGSITNGVPVANQADCGPADAGGIHVMHFGTVTVTW